jgi:hypothetical protein
MSTLQDVEAWHGKKMIDADGDKVGTIEAVFLDRQTGQVSPPGRRSRRACSAISTLSSQSATRR